MDDLVQWLTACLNAEEAEVRLTADAFGAVWTTNDAMESVGSDTGADVVSEPYAPRSFIAEHDPARVLREIEIDRELLAEYERLLRAHEAHRKEADRLTQSDDDDPIRRNALRREADYLPAMLHVVERWAKRKAAVYSHRPGFKEEWRP